jgi:hypothetical protein
MNTDITELINMNSHFDWHIYTTSYTTKSYLILSVSNVTNSCYNIDIKHIQIKQIIIIKITVEVLAKMDS